MGLASGERPQVLDFGSILQKASQCPTLLTSQKPPHPLNLKSSQESQSWEAADLSCSPVLHGQLRDLSDTSWPLVCL
jgi:hypothetical protein